MIECAKVLRRKPYGMISLVTNGLLVDEVSAKQVVENGIRRVQVSMDGARPESHERLRNKKGAFTGVLNAVECFKKAGAESIEVAFCPTSFNIEEFPDVAKICEGLKINSIRIQPLMLLGRANKNLEQILPCQSQYRHLVRTIHQLRTEGRPLIIEWGDPVDHLIRFRTLCKHLVQFLGIKANGGIAPSPYLPLVIGNVRKHKLSEYWDAGLGRAWELDIVSNLAGRINCVADYNKSDADVPVVWEDSDIEADLIDDKLLSGF